MIKLEQIKLSKERIHLIAQLKSGQIKGFDVIKATKRVIEIVMLLGGQSQQIINTLYQAVIDGKKTLSIQTVRDVFAEAQKDQKHWQLSNAVEALAREAIEKDVITSSEYDALVSGT
ncbi:hypothetical protein [Acinetobacter boissieri]|uniref:Uncharacterized protein n=1 Tax=Acinetobacter boissieri TaxID=1219383 RepID=A0A1G6GYJ3_9GAMM|nr:hypothetical protein [Acinetobacter boissieri]SDB87014.1 hypothetical protein SAMN05421733_10329 [Acinetobacter boissieri]